MREIPTAIVKHGGRVDLGDETIGTVHKEPVYGWIARNNRGQWLGTYRNRSDAVTCCVDDWRADHPTRCTYCRELAARVRNGEPICHESSCARQSDAETSYRP